MQPCVCGAQDFQSLRKLPLHDGRTMCSDVPLPHPRAYYWLAQNLSTRGSSPFPLLTFSDATRGLGPCSYRALHPTSAQPCSLGPP